MKNLITILLLVGLFFPACKKLEIEEGTPNCIRSKISAFEKDAFCSDPQVDEYQFQSEYVYVFIDGSCGADLAATVFDSKCNIIGRLGGIEGNTKINGEEFNAAKFIKTVWKK